MESDRHPLHQLIINSITSLLYNSLLNPTPPAPFMYVLPLHSTDRRFHLFQGHGNLTLRASLTSSNPVSSTHAYAYYIAQTCLLSALGAPEGPVFTLQKSKRDYIRTRKKPRAESRQVHLRIPPCRLSHGMKYVNATQRPNGPYVLPLISKNGKCECR